MKPKSPATGLEATRQEMERLKQVVSRQVLQKPEKAAKILAEWIRAESLKKSA